LKPAGLKLPIGHLCRCKAGSLRPCEHSQDHPARSLAPPAVFEGDKGCEARTPHSEPASLNRYVLSADAKQPRCARVNTLKTTLEEALRLLQSLGGTEAVKQDPLIPNLLVFPPGTDLHDHALVKDGRLILQVRSRRKVEDDKEDDKKSGASDFDESAFGQETQHSISESVL
jgi:hypothetical protein